jgi:hypothetical protein
MKLSKIPAWCLESTDLSHDLQLYSLAHSIMYYSNADSFPFCISSLLISNLSGKQVDLGLCSLEALCSLLFLFLFFWSALSLAALAFPRDAFFWGFVHLFVPTKFYSWQSQKLATPFTNDQQHSWILLSYIMCSVLNNTAASVQLLLGFVWMSIFSLKALNWTPVPIAK